MWIYPVVMQFQLFTCFPQQLSSYAWGGIKKIVHNLSWPTSFFYTKKNIFISIQPSQSCEAQVRSVSVLSLELTSKTFITFLCLFTKSISINTDIAKLYEARVYNRSPISGRITFIFMNYGRQWVQDIFYVFSVLHLHTKPSLLPHVFRRLYTK